MRIWFVMKHQHTIFRERSDELKTAVFFFFLIEDSMTCQYCQFEILRKSNKMCKNTQLYHKTVTLMQSVHKYGKLQCCRRQTMPDGWNYSSFSHQSISACRSSLYPWTACKHTHTGMFPVYVLSSFYYKQMSTSAHGGNAPRGFLIGLAFSFSLP